MPNAILFFLLTAVLVLGCDNPWVDPPDREAVERARESLGRATEKVKESGEVAKRAGEKLRKVGESVGELAAELVLPPEQEEKLGDRMAAEIASKSELIESGPVVEYVRKLGDDLVAVAEDKPKGFKFDFHVQRDDAVNAFAIPGGHIYVTTGLLQSAQSEAELAAVLGHEIAHVTERHIAQRMSATYGVSMLTQLALGQESGVLQQMAAELVTQGFLLKHSRDNEREADTSGLAYVVAAGHSPKGYLDFFERLAEQPTPPALLSTHPNPEERVENARRMIAELDPAVVNRPVQNERYQKMMFGL